jgi:arylsulfatase A-like enzyme
MPEAEDPNVVVFFTDQQRWDTVGAYGSPMDLTPNLDAAAAEGTLVENAISSQPVCGPTRACLQTGEYATTNGVYTNAGTLRDVDHLIARVFDRAGYETGYVGKWHLAGTTTDPVPERARGGYRDYWRVADSLEHTSHPYEGLVYDGDGERVEFDGYRTDALTDMAIEFVRRDREDPFFLTLSQIEPHHQNDMETYVAPDGYAYEHRNPWVPPDLRGTPGDWYEELPDYYGICERLDECYGRLLDALDEEGILEETIVLFVSDHGSHFRTRNGEYKRSCHESSVRVPMVLRGPGFRDGGRISEPVSLVDVPPTLIDAAGIEVPDAMEGESVVPLVEGEADPNRDVFIQISEAEVGRALRTDRWKYSVYAPDAESHSTPQPDEYVERYLYDLAADPYEQTNLVGRDDYRAVADELRRRLVERIEEVEGKSVDVRAAEFYD